MYDLCSLMATDSSNVRCGLPMESPGKSSPTRRNTQILGRVYRVKERVGRIALPPPDTAKISVPLFRGTVSVSGKNRGFE